jgi:hypothetical protein
MEPEPTSSDETSDMHGEVAEESDEEEKEEAVMTIKCDWALGDFSRKEDLKAGFEYLFHPKRHWRLKGSNGFLKELTWTPGLFWFKEQGTWNCSRSYKEIKRGFTPEPFTHAPSGKPRKAAASGPLTAVHITFSSPETKPPSLIQPEPPVETWLPPPPLKPPMDPNVPIPIEAPPEEYHDPLQLPEAPPLVSPSIPEASPKSVPALTPSPPPALSLVDEDKKEWKVKGTTFTLKLEGIERNFPSARRHAFKRRGWVKKYFGNDNFAFFDTVEQKPKEHALLLPNRTCQLRVKPKFSAAPLPKEDRKYVTFIAELGRRENVEVKDSDSEDKQAAMFRSFGIHGPRRLLIEDREISWSDLQTGDVVTVERITDASVWVIDEKGTEEFKYLKSDSVSAGRMVQSHWPGFFLLRKFDRAPPASWVPNEQLWILKENQWHRWMTFRGQQREISFISEDQFFRQAEIWVNGTVNITDDEGNEVYLQDTVDTECYTLVKSDYGKNITFRLDGLIMEAAFDGMNSRFWSIVRKLVNAKEQLCLMNKGKIVSPDRALSKITYQLVRNRNGKTLQEVQFQRGEEIIDADLRKEEALSAIKDTWGEGNWKIVDRIGTPFPFTDLRDGTTYFALKEGELLQNRGQTRSFSHFTANKVSDEVRFMINCEKQVHQVCMKPFARWKLMETCKSIWGPGYYKWDDKDLKNLNCRVLHVQKRPAKPDPLPVINFKVRYED